LTGTYVIDGFNELVDILFGNPMLFEFDEEFKFLCFQVIYILNFLNLF
jgi:hypothetical protein